MNSFRELTVWQRSVELVDEFYILTKKFPKEEMFGLTSQMRRAAASIPANIAEGYARKHRREYVQFLRIAFGSGAELESHIAVAQKLEFLGISDSKSVESLLDETMRMLNKFIATLVAKP